MIASFRPRIFGDTGDAPAVLLVAERESERRIFASMLRREGCRLEEAADAYAALDRLSAANLDLVVLDREMDSMDANECCRRIKSNRRTAFTPVIMIAGPFTASDEIAGIQAGADQFIAKPLHPEVFRTRIRGLLRRKHAVDRLEETESVLFALAQTVEKRDPCTGVHCQRLAIYGIAFGMKLGLTSAQLLALYRGGYLHDIGKIAIPDSILFKPGKLSPEEWTVMQTHSMRGEEICASLGSLAPVLPIVRHHHERWNGTGYPDGLKGSDIPMLARVLQFVDVYDALITDRPYKKACSREQALDILRSETEAGWRDPELAEVFLHLNFDKLEMATQSSIASETATTFENSLFHLQHRLLV